MKLKREEAAAGASASADSDALVSGFVETIPPKAGKDQMRDLKSNALSSMIARDVMLGASAVALLCCVLFAAVFYFTLDHQLETDLTAECGSLAAVLDEAESAGVSPAQVLSEQAIVARPETRVTLIEHDGTVLYDNTANVALLDNHSLRPEVMQALEAGEGQSGRFSDTLQEETLYHAIRLENGSVLRLAGVQASIWGIMGTMLVPACMVLLIALGISALVGSTVGRRIGSTIARLDLDDPLGNEAPEEMVPLLVRLNEQRKRIDAQAAERRRFTANVSHELKTPLTVVSGYAEIIEKGIAKPEDVQHCAGLIHLEAQHMRTMVDDLLTLSRMDDMISADARFDMGQKVSLGKMAHTMAARLRPAAEPRGIAITVETPEDDGLGEVCVEGSQRMLDEMTRNLIENAIRYNKDGGYVLVRVFRDVRGCAVLSVADTGIGIAPELREKVFERFFCIDESRSKETGGSGLGLAIVKHAAQLHGAVVNIRDNVPEGSVFEITFPLR